MTDQATNQHWMDFLYINHICYKNWWHKELLAYFNDFMEGAGVAGSINF